MIMPLGTYMTPNRLNGLAAVFCSAESAGTMLSNSGNASIDPRPRKTVRRGIAFFEMIIAGSFQWSTTEDAEDAEQSNLEFGIGNSEFVKPRPHSQNSKFQILNSEFLKLLSCASSVVRLSRYRLPRGTASAVVFVASPLATAILNGALLTIPVMTDDQE